MCDVCFSCLNERELNREHIVPQCLGGTLTAKIYCEKCNSQLGHQVDAEVARSFGRYATLLNVARDRGINRPFNIVDDQTELRLRFDGEAFARSDPKVSIDRDATGQVSEFEVFARSEEELRKISSNILDKYNLEPSLVLFEEIDRLPPITSHEFVLDGQLIHRAIAKIAYGFACQRLPQEVIVSAAFDQIRSVITGASTDKIVSSNYVNGDFMTDNLRPLHKIVLQLNRGDQFIVGYVALFGTFRYTVLVADPYVSDLEWPIIDYTFNPVTQMEVPANINFLPPTITRDAVTNPRQSKRQVEEALQRGFNVLADHSQALLDADIETL